MFRAEKFTSYRQNFSCFGFSFTPLALVTQDYAEVAQRIRHVQVIAAVQLTSDCEALHRGGFRLLRFSFVPVYAAKVIKGGGYIRVVFAEPPAPECEGTASCFL